MGALEARDELPDSVHEELSQARARLGVCVFALFYLAGWSFFAGPVRPVTVWVVGGYGIASALWFLLIRRHPEPVPWRRILTILGDLGINTFFMHTLQEKGAFFYPMYLWIIVGNGVRFGPRYLALATSVGVAYFLPMLFFSAYWRTNAVAGAGLLAGLVVLPLFYLSLIRRLYAANAQLAEEAERSQAAARSKTEFLANMSHELRTPMNGVLGVADLMRTTPLSPLQDEYVGLMQRSARTLLRIIDDILDFARIEAGRITLKRKPFDLRTVVEDVFELLRPRAAKTRLEVRYDYPTETPFAFLGDPTRIRQILFNLLGNALKFTERGSVSLQVSCDPPGSERLSGNDPPRREVRFEIVDTGVGIPGEELERIFERFERAESRMHRHFGGSGLGLAISRHLARLMGGDVTARSKPGEGATFLVTLTLDEEAPAAASALAQPEKTAPEETAPESPAPKPTATLRALVVEDEPINLLVTVNLLEALGISSVSAENGAKAIEAWQSGQVFDLVFLDIRLPDIDGLEVCRRIRAQETKAPIPIVALTANTTREDEEKCLAVGMNLFLRKPFRLRELREAIETLRPRGPGDSTPSP